MVEDYGWAKEEKEYFFLCLLCPVQSLGMTFCRLYRIKTGTDGEVMKSHF